MGVRWVTPKQALREIFSRGTPSPSTTGGGGSPKFGCGTLLFFIVLGFILLYALGEK